MAHIRYASDDIEAALRQAQSSNAAAQLLGMSRGALAKRCKGDPRLKPLFQRAVKRGKALNGRRHA